MKVDNRSSKPILSGSLLDFFYGILTLWESPEENKVLKDFNSAEIKRFLAREDNKGMKTLFFTSDANKKDYNHKYELFVKNSRNNQGLSLLYHLRNAFAHNDIQMINGKDIYIRHEWNGILKLKTTISFKVLKEFIETIRGEHNLTEEEKKQKQLKRKKQNETFFTKTIDGHDYYFDYQLRFGI